MKKKFSYEIKDSEGLKDMLHNFENSCKEDFKQTFFTLNQLSYSRAAECYSNPQNSLSSAEECFNQAIQPLQEYDAAKNEIWKSELGKLNRCIERVKRKSDDKISTCVNKFAANAFTRFTQLDDKYKTEFI